MKYKNTEIGKIPESWEVMAISEIGEVIAGGTPKTKIDEYWNGNISWITPRDLSSYNKKYIYKGERSITELGLNNSSAKLLPEGTVLFSSRAPIGYVAIAGIEMATNQGFKNIVCDDKVSNNNFIYYLMKYKKEDIENIAGGSTFKEVSGKIVKEFRIQIPPLPEQKSIADTLSSLDDKIELNNKINENLEQQAQAIFKHWFVDFEFPNEEGKPYKSSGGEMIDSELGMIPKGWEVINIKNMTTLSHTGGDAIRKVPIVDYDTGIKCARVGDLSQNRPINEWAYCKVDEENFKKYKLEKGDMLVTRTASLGLNKMINKSGKVVFNNGLIRLRFKQEYELSYIKYIFDNKQFMNYINMITGDSSTRPNMKIRYLLNYKIPLAPKYLQKNYQLAIEPMIRKIHLNLDQNQTLSQLRDTLLPKLMSGEIRIPL